MSIYAVALAHMDSVNEAKPVDLRETTRTRGGLAMRGSNHLNNMRNINQGLKRLGMFGGLVSKTFNI